MNRPTRTYYFAGHHFSKEELIHFCDEKLAETASEFEKDVFAFVKEWLLPSEMIRAKTSGSTGKPKEILLQKKYMLASAESTIDFFKLKEKDKVLLCLPMEFIAGKMMVVRALVGGLDLYITEPTSKPEIPNIQIEFAAMVPIQLSQLLSDHRAAFSQIHKLIIGGSFISRSLLHQLQNVNTAIWQTYGMTETMTHIAVRKLNGHAKSDMYTPLPGVEISTDDGRIVINASHLGVKHLITNDLANVYVDGKFKILGRADHVIISGGLKIHPEEIESKLSGILNCNYMIGSIKDDKLGERLILYIEKGDNNERLIFSIWEEIEQVLQKHEIPKEIVFVPEIFKTTSGKTDRNRLLDQYQ